VCVLVGPFACQDDPSFVSSLSRCLIFRQVDHLFVCGSGNSVSVSILIEWDLLSRFSFLVGNVGAAFSLKEESNNLQCFLWQAMCNGVFISLLLVFNWHLWSATRNWAGDHVCRLCAVECCLFHLDHLKSHSFLLARTLTVSWSYLEAIYRMLAIFGGSVQWSIPLCVWSVQVAFFLVCKKLDNFKLAIFRGRNEEEFPPLGSVCSTGISDLIQVQNNGHIWRLCAMGYSLVHLECWTHNLKMAYIQRQDE